jgi:sialic acid synthase
VTRRAGRVPREGEAAVLPTVLRIPSFVAEIGCNHTGSLEVAKQMVVAARDCGADIVKFQKRCARELLTPEQYDAPYENPNSYGRTYGLHREFLELDVDAHAELKAHAEAHEVEYSTSVWDMTSARQIVALRPALLKVPSACNNHFAMLELLRDEFGGEVHMSTGMSTHDEIDKAVDVFARCPERVVLYACTSAYPTAFRDVSLLEILRLRERYEATGRVRSIAFSGHHKGTAVDLGAMMLGVSHIERHFTLDRTWRGSDHAASLEPPDFSRLARDTKRLADAWAHKRQPILEAEEAQRRKLRHRSSQTVEPKE